MSKDNSLNINRINKRYINVNIVLCNILALLEQLLQDPDQEKINQLQDLLKTYFIEEECMRNAFKSALCNIAETEKGVIDALETDEGFEL